MIVEILDFLHARRKIQSLIDQRNETFDEQLTQKTTIAATLANKDMDRFEAIGYDRLRSVESKARTNLMSITIATTIAAIFLGTQFTHPESGMEVHYPASVVIGYISIGLGWLCFVVSGWFALQVLDVSQRYVLDPESYVNSSKVELRARRLFILEQNQSLMTLKTNALSVSFRAIRNGIILFFVGMALIVIARLGTIG